MVVQVKAAGPGSNTEGMLFSTHPRGHPDSRLDTGMPMVQGWFEDGTQRPGGAAASTHQASTNVKLNLEALLPTRYQCESSLTTCPDLTGCQVSGGISTDQRASRCWGRAVPVGNVTPTARLNASVAEPTPTIVRWQKHESSPNVPLGIAAG